MAWTIPMTLWQNQWLYCKANDSIGLMDRSLEITNYSPPHTFSVTVVHQFDVAPLSGLSLDHLPSYCKLWCLFLHWCEFLSLYYIILMLFPHVPPSLIILLSLCCIETYIICCLSPFLISSYPICVHILCCCIQLNGYHFLSTCIFSVMILNDMSSHIFFIILFLTYILHDYSPLIFTKIMHIIHWHWGLYQM